jgi:putative DNA primase/helicase
VRAALQTLKRRKALDAALSRRTKSPAYLAALAADGAMRIGLDGAPVEPVTIEHQIFALDRLAEIERSWTRRSAAPAEARPSWRVETIARALNGRHSGNGWICRCPAHDDHDPSLRITERDGKVLLKCWSGCPQDAVIDALKRRNLWNGKATWGRPKKKDPSAESDKPRDPMKPWRNAAPFVRGSVADRYFKFRGIELTDDEASSLRVTSSLWHWLSQTYWPAMLARVTLHNGIDLTTHQTFIKPDGSGKAPIDKPRLFAAGGETAGGGVWFGIARPELEFIVGEGIESTLSEMRLRGATAGCAALSETGIRRLILPPAAQRVHISADHDHCGQGIAAARAAARRWRAEGRKVAASMAPKVGEDANDLLLKRRYR